MIDAIDVIHLKQQLDESVARYELKFKYIIRKGEERQMLPVRANMIIRGPLIRRPLVRRCAVRGVARLHPSEPGAGGGVALRLGRLALGHEQLGGFALHRGRAR